MGAFEYLKSNFARPRTFRDRERVPSLRSQPGFNTRPIENSALRKAKVRSILGSVFSLRHSPILLIDWIWYLY